MPSGNRRVLRRSSSSPTASKSAAPSKTSKRSSAPAEDEDDDEMMVHGGWTEAQKQMDSASPYAQALKLEAEGQVIKFLEDTPYANYRRHWIDRTSAQGGTVRRAFFCLGTNNKECPLCDIGDRAQAVSAFNVVVLGDDDQILLKTWDVGARLLNVLKAHNNDKRVGPLSRGYFLVSKTGKGNNSQTNVTPIKASALKEDWELDLVTEDQLDKIKPYTGSIVEITPLKTLKGIAAELSEEYD